LVDKPPEKVILSEAQLKFVNSDAPIIALIGPQGEGKTFAGLWGIARHAVQMRDKGDHISKGLIIRDTFENIKAMTVPSLIKASNGAAIFSDGGKKMQFLNVEGRLIGIDDMASLSKLQGDEPEWVWLEEPAPIAAKENAGLREEVFDIAFSRCGRRGYIPPRVQVTMNPADEDHWTYRKFISDPIDMWVEIKGEKVHVHTETINIPYGENDNIEQYNREQVKIAYKDRPDLYRRYVDGEFSFIAVGEAVTPEFNEKLHVTKSVLEPDKMFDTYRFWDGGLNPTCVFMQITPRGRFNFTDCVRGENIGVRQLIETRVKNIVASRYRDIKKYRDIGDPSMMNREQSDSSQTAADVINTELGASFERGESGWDARRECLKEMFNRMVDGEPMVQISKHLGNMIRCFRGGWHYHKDSSGKILKDSAVKDIHSHIGDAVSHGVARLLLLPKMKDKLKKIRDANLRRHGRMR